MVLMLDVLKTAWFLRLSCTLTGGLQQPVWCLKLKFVWCLTVYISMFIQTNWQTWSNFKFLSSQKPAKHQKHSLFLTSNPNPSATSISSANRDESRIRATHCTKKMEPIRASMRSQMAPNLAKRSMRINLRTRPRSETKRGDGKDGKVWFSQPKLVEANCLTPI